MNAEWLREPRKSEARTEEMFGEDCYELDHNDLVIFGDSKNDESSLMNSALMDFFEGDSILSQDHCQKAHTPATPVSTLNSTNTGSHLREHSKKGSKKSTSKKRASQTNLHKLNGQRKAGRTPITMNGVLKEIVHKKKENGASQHTNMESLKYLHEFEITSKKEARKKETSSGSSKNLQMYFKQQENSSSKHSSILRSNLKDSDLFQSYLRANSKFNLEEIIGTDEKVEATAFETSEPLLIETPSLANLPKKDPGLFTNATNAERRQPTKQVRSFHTSLLSVISSLGPQESQKNAIQDKIGIDQRPRLAKANTESEVQLLKKEPEKRLEEDTSVLQQMTSNLKSESNLQSTFNQPPRTATSKGKKMNPLAKKGKSQNKENSKIRDGSASSSNGEKLRKLNQNTLDSVLKNSKVTSNNQPENK